MKRFAGLVTVIILCLIVTSAVWANRSEWKLVSWEQGIVENQYSGAGEWHQIWRSRMLNDGDRVRTQANSKGRVKLADQSTFLLGEKTEVELSQFQVRDNSAITKLKLFTGKIRSNVGRLTGKQTRYEVRTPRGVLAARGTDFLVEHGNGTSDNNDEDNTILVVFSKAVDVTAGGRTVTVKEGNYAVLAPDGSITVQPSAAYLLRQRSSHANSVDADLYKNTPETFTTTASGAEIPADPLNVGSVTALPGTGEGTQQPGTAVVPPTNTGGTVIINIVPR